TVAESDAPVTRRLHIAELYGLELFGDSLFAQIVAADRTQGHVQPMTGKIVQKAESFRIVGEAVPIHVVADGRACDFNQFLLTLGKSHFPKFLDLASFFESHITRKGENRRENLFISKESFSKRHCGERIRRERMDSMPPSASRPSSKAAFTRS